MRLGKLTALFFWCACAFGQYNPGSGSGPGGGMALISPSVANALVMDNGAGQAVDATSGSTINATGGTMPTIPAADLAIVDATTGRILSGAFANPGFFTSVRWDGTVGAPTAVQAGEQVGGYNSYAYNGTSLVGPLGSIRCFANQNQAVGAGGTYCEVATTPNGSTTLTSRMRFEADGGVTLPSTVTGGDQGIGTLNASGLFVDGVAVTTGTPITSCGGTAGQVLRASGTAGQATCDSGFTYAGAGGQVRVGLGSLAAPAIIYGTDTGTGWFENTVGSWIFSSSGTGLMGLAGTTVKVPSGTVYSWTNGGIGGAVDSNVSRISSGVVGMGTGAAGSTGGSTRGASYQSGGTTFTMSGCSATTPIGGASAGSFLSGTTGACTVVITLNGATGITAPNGWTCAIYDLSSAINVTTGLGIMSQTASSTTTCTISGLTVSGDKLQFLAMAF